MAAQEEISWLFVPGDRADRFDKAAASGADVVIIDLEDAVAPEHKTAARQAASHWLRNGGSAWLRVNGIDTAWHADDVADLAMPGLRGLIVPKAEDVAALRSLSERLSPSQRLVALVESALGVANALQIAQSGAVHRLAFGAIDYALDIRAGTHPEALLLPRSMLVLASRVAGLPPPIDAVTTSVDDPETLSEDAVRARDLGFGGKLCIHPRQVAKVTSAFAPKRTQIEWAERVLSAVPPDAGVGSTSVRVLDGQMIDKPVLERARRILAMRSRADTSVKEAR